AASAVSSGSGSGSTWWLATISRAVSRPRPWSRRAAYAVPRGLASRPRRRWPGPTSRWPSSRAMSVAWATAILDSVSNRVYMEMLLSSGPWLPHSVGVAGVLLVNRLTADLQHVGDRLPAPALLACVADLDRLEAVGQRAEGPDGGESLL